jgi:cytidylate kinase
MVKIQRNLGKDTNLIAEGRDTTTVVFPDATIKVFLTASLEERVKRRHKELLEKGMQLTLDEVRENIIQRDRIDSSREVSPLKKADDAVEIDSTNMTIPDEIYKILNMIEEATGMKLRKSF